MTDFAFIMLIPVHLCGAFICSSEAKAWGGGREKEKFKSRQRGIMEKQWEIWPMKEKQ